MKKILLLILLLSLSLSSFIDNKNKSIKGVWSLNQIRLNNDTIFYRGDFEYTLLYNYKLNSSWITTNEDSSKVFNQAKSSFENSLSIRIEFLTDSTFAISKIRSGGRMIPNELDYGIYERRNDTILLTNQSRDNKKMVLFINNKSDEIYLEDGLPDYKIYQEYIRKK